VSPVVHFIVVEIGLGTMNPFQMHRVRQTYHCLRESVVLGATGQIQHDHSQIDHLVHYPGHATRMLQSRLLQGKQHDHMELQETSHNLHHLWQHMVLRDSFRHRSSGTGSRTQRNKG